MGPLNSSASRDHLRVCGADYAGTTGTTPDSGSSPRVRSRHCISSPTRSSAGIISACAEQTVEFYTDSDRLESSKYSIAAMKEMLDVAKSTS